ncbi:hypothetical protein [Mycobacteroides saopaulense]|uniref:hypothetical protein n=1 Tax=Mycobacteroides saopaulense TaxID=1578165 RepID=UPI001F2ACC00|nr:hypothetical protein [Mycobacteroides saopaulense]
MSPVGRDASDATTVLTCRDLTHSSEPQPAPAATGSVPLGADGGRRIAAVAAGLVLVVAAVAGLHGLYRAGSDVAAWGVWSVLLLAGMTALGGGIKLAMWGFRPMIAAVSATGKERLSEPVQAFAAALGVIAGAVGMWWTLRGGCNAWWQHLSGAPGWTLLLGVGQMAVAVLAGAALFTGGRYLTGLSKEVLTDVGMLGARGRASSAENAGAHRHTAASSSGGDEKLWHPGLLAALIAGGAGLVLLAAGITPKLYVWIAGPDVFPAVTAIAITLVWGIGSNLGWWKGLGGLYAWATDASQKASAVAGVVALLMFSAGGLGLGWFTPATVPQARAACPPDCGGPGGSDGPPGGGQMFQPPSQGGPQMPDYQGGINQPPMDQNSSISIYNTQAPSVGNTSGSQGAQQGPQQGWDQPAHGTQPPDYQNATPYTQGPGRPNPDYNPGGQPNSGSQGAQPNQGAQQPPANQGNQGAQQPPSQNSGQQPPQENTGQQPQQSDQQRLDELTRQLQDQQQQSTQDRQRIDDLTKQLQRQQGQQKNGNQKLPKAPSKDKKQDDKDQQDQDDQSGNNDLSALLMGAASTRRRKQDDQPQPNQQQVQGPDTQALAQDGAQLGQSLPGDIANTVSDSVNLGQSAGSAAQNFGSAAQAGASLASSAQSGAVNPMDAVAVVQGISGGISDTADAVGSGASIASTWLGEAGQGTQLAADANPQLKPQAEQIQQLTKAGGQVADLTGKVAGGVSQVSGMVNTASSLGTSGIPDTSGATDALSGTATAVNGPSDIPTSPTPPAPSAPPQSSSSVQALDSTTTRAPHQPDSVDPSKGRAPSPGEPGFIGPVAVDQPPGQVPVSYPVGSSSWEIPGHPGIQVIRSTDLNGSLLNFTVSGRGAARPFTDSAGKQWVETADNKNRTVWVSPDGSFFDGPFVGPPSGHTVTQPSLKDLDNWVSEKGQGVADFFFPLEDIYKGVTNWQDASTGENITTTVQILGMLPGGGIVGKFLGKGGQWVTRLIKPAERAGGSVGRLTIENIMTDPKLLAGRTPQEVESALGNVPGWRVESLGKGGSKGEGWVFREYTEKGNPTGKMLRWHPGGGHHGPDPYWRVIGPNGDLGGVIR